MFDREAAEHDLPAEEARLYSALYLASKLEGLRDHERQKAAHVRHNRAEPFQYVPSALQNELSESASALLAGSLSPEAARALLARPAVATLLAGQSSPPGIESSSFRYDPESTRRLYARVRRRLDGDA